MLPSSTIRDLVIPKNSNLKAELTAGEETSVLLRVVIPLFLIGSGSTNGSSTGSCGCVGELIERIIALRRLACSQGSFIYSAVFAYTSSALNWFFLF